MFFNGWETLGRTVLIGALSYFALIVLLRVSGKRTLSKMNAFDLVVTVALGSTLATILLSRDVALVQGIVAFALLITLQLTITWLSVRSPTVAKLVKAEPTLLVYRGEFLRRAMRQERVLETEILSTLRSNGVASVAQVDSVVLETNGQFSVISCDTGDKPLTTLDNITLPGEGTKHSSQHPAP